MSVALGFASSDVLRVVMTSGIAAPDVMARGARAARRADGGVVLAPDAKLSAGQLAQLRAAGVAVDAALPADARAVRCWAEALPMARVAAPTPALALLVTEDPAALVDLAAELVRLGCDRQELCAAGDLAAIRVVDPPTYTVMRALDHEAGLRVFVAEPAGQDQVWSELGYRHPLIDRLRAEPGTLLLVGADRWRSLPAEGWRGVDAVLELAVPRAEAMAPGLLPARRTIELRLAGGRREPPSLWVLRDGGVAAVDHLLSYLPEEVVARLAFAVSGDVVIVRARGGRQAPPELALAGEAYAPLVDLPDVHAPAGAIVEPPLRRDHLRQVLAVAPGDVVWLAALPERRFRVERIADRAFRPLTEWAEYVLHASAPALVPWLRATVFDFAPLISLAREPAPAPTPVEDPRPRRTRSPRRAEPPPAPEAPPPEAAPVPEPAVLAREPARVTDVEIDAELAAREAEFVALDAPGDAPERLALLAQLADGYARRGRRRDAGLCFARVAWEAPDAARWLDAWLAADRWRPERLRALLAQPEPDPDDVRQVAAAAARGVGDPHAVQRWLDDHDGELDARTLWLARLGLARAAGGDALGLAHARDRVLARLVGGLPVERELPAFLQFSGRSGALGSASGDHLGDALEDLVQRIARTRRKRSMMEAPAHHTNAYAHLQLAHGFARIGKHDRARGLVDDARAALAPAASDPVHAYLIAAFAARIDQAIAGLPPEAAPPPALVAQLAALDRLARYKVDRLLEASRILEPSARADALGVYIHRPADAPEAALAQLAPRARVAAIARLVDAAAHQAVDRARLVTAVLDAVLALGEADAVPLLARTWPLIRELAPAQRAMAYAEALVVAGHFGRTELVPALLERLGASLWDAEDLPRVLQRSLRALRRIGLRAETAELLAGAEHAAAGALRGRLAIAAGLAYLGDPRALPIFDQARAALAAEFARVAATPKDAPRPALTDALGLTRALALAYAQAPLGHALGGIAELAEHLRDVTDSFGTNSHFCLSVLDFVESLVLGITSDDLALGEAGRRFVEDDEHLIRRRLHRDLGGRP